MVRRGHRCIRAGKIVFIGRLPDGASADTTIDAHGRVVAPGFIDMLGQSETTILVDARLPSKIYQGITTEVTGEGNTIAPVNERLRALSCGLLREPELEAGLEQRSPNTSRGLSAREWGSILASYVGATQVRSYVVGDGDRAPSRALELGRDARSGCRLRCAMVPWAFRPLCNMRPRLTPRPKS